jgi:hypothetical protein
MKVIFFFFLTLFVNAEVFAHGMSPAEQQRLLEGGNIEYIRLGALHMLTGYDHLLFLFGIIFFLTSFRDIVKFVTAFTLGHSLTLFFGTLLTIKINYYIIDAVIALSVCYKGFENIDGFKKYLNVNAPDLLSVVFIFGLCHGFGLATRLQQLPLGDSGLLMRILSFNAGVELGQIAALLVMLLCISRWRKSSTFHKFSIASNVGLIVSGIFLFMMQMHGFMHQRFQNDFGISKKAHTDAHDEMRVNKIIEDDVFNLRK